MSLAAETAMALTAALEGAVNTWIAMDPEAATRLARFSNKVIAIELQDTGVTLYCLPQDRGLSIMLQYSGEPDTIITGRPVSLAKLSLLGDTRVMFDGEVTIRGDVELGQQFKKTLENIDIDWEEHLSRIMGDVLAHKAAYTIREMASWWRNNRERAAHNGREYLQQELNAIPTRAEAEVFYTAIENLRDDVARLAARIKLLQDRPVS